MRFGWLLSLFLTALMASLIIYGSIAFVLRIKFMLSKIHYGRRKRYDCVIEAVMMPTFVSVDKNNEVTLVDPNCTGGTDDPRYMGTWTVPMSEFENIVNYDGWIAVYTKAADGYYVYE